MDRSVQVALRRRLADVDDEIADLRGLIAIARRIERDVVLRERLRSAELPFRLQDLFAGRITGKPLQRALAELDRLAAPVQIAR